ncbi:MAG: agmatine deiminase family protein [Bacteroidota bacterium]
MNKTPRQLGYRFPAEWEPQAATWFSWPHNKETWPGKFDPIPGVFTNIVKTLASYQHVNINVVDDAMADDVRSRLLQAGVHPTEFTLFTIPTNDCWCRDHGPAFVVNPNSPEPLAVIDWGYNAWGGKYPPYDMDDIVPSRVADLRNIPVFHPGIIMEGGAIDVNGEGCLLTSKSCLLNENRNPALTQAEIEEYLTEYYNVEKILWIDEGIAGDDTDGHIDDTARFVGPNTIVAVVENNPADENHRILRKNLLTLKAMTDVKGNPFRIVDVPMPAPIFFNGQRLPASYANFLIANNIVLVPTFRDPNDNIAIEILQREFQDRTVLGIDCVDLAWGLGTLHCISQQEPKVNSQ